MNKELLKIKKELVKTFGPSKEDIQAEKLCNIITEARNSGDRNIQKLLKQLNEVF